MAYAIMDAGERDIPKEDTEQYAADYQANDVCDKIIKVAGAIHEERLQNLNEPSYARTENKHLDDGTSRCLGLGQR